MGGEMKILDNQLKDHHDILYNPDSEKHITKDKNFVCMCVG